VEVVLCQRNRAESASIRPERKIGHQVDQWEFIPLILNAGAEMDAEFHDRPSCTFLCQTKATRAYPAWHVTSAAGARAPLVIQTGNALNEH
jgi:hypothetical protein